MKRIFILLIFGLIGSPFVKAQELNCSVEIMSQQVQGVNPAIFESLEQMIFEFMNNRKWTKDQFTIEERIRCSIVINIDPSASASSNRYTGTLQIISGRPIFNTDYYSPVLNIQDKNFQFEYVPNTQYVFNPDNFQHNLLHVLAFYAYLIIGYDYDTYSLRGGTPYYQQAQRIVQAASTSNAEGWKAFEGDKNRYWLAEDIMHRTFEPMRDCLYEYHRLGMDLMSEKMPKGRTACMRALVKMDKVHKVKPLAYSTQAFFLAKSDEIVNIFSQADPPERNQLFEVISKVDPGNLGKYEKMQKGK
ncbi:MAG: DUF4835 family protein [Cryomorphaceae bacterium]|nr:DUF4835 family protein [Flavobacteriales bacterium]